MKLRGIKRVWSSVIVTKLFMYNKQTKNFTDAESLSNKTFELTPI